MIYLRVKTICVMLIIILLSNCSRRGETNPDQNTQKLNNELGIPYPDWDSEINDLMSDFEKTYHAKEVRFTRPYFYISEEDKNYWLRVALLNPDLKDKPLKQFGEEVALNVLKHLANPDDFEKIEISVTQKTGFILTFTKNENTFFYLDSLRNK